MNFKHGFIHSNFLKRRLSSSISLDSDHQFEQNFPNNNTYCNNNSNNLSATSNFNTYSAPMPSNKTQPSPTRKRRNNKAIQPETNLKEENCKLQTFSSCSLPVQNDLLSDQSSDLDNQQDDFCSETTSSKSEKGKQQVQDKQLDDSQIFNDPISQRKWKKVLSKMFFYDKENDIKKCDEGKAENYDTDDFQKPKELYVLMNKKETKRLMKMRSDSKYHKCDTLNILSCTKGNIVKKFKNNVFQGVPDSLRGTVWQTIIDPFHSFCIKLNPETASLINTHNSTSLNNNNNSNEKNSSNASEKKKSNKGSFINQPSEFANIVNEELNDHESEPNYIPSIPIQNANYNNSSVHSIEYVKINLHTNKNLVHFLASRATSDALCSIEGDVGRTLIQFKKMRNPATQNSLKNILAAYSVVDNKLGYAQGMGFIAAMLLLYMDENSTFNCFCNIMLSKRFGFRNLFINGFPRIQAMNKVWTVALQSYFPHLERKLARSNIDPIVYTVGWWIANFLNFPLPDDVLLLLFDRNLLFGSMSLISFGLTIFGICHEYLEKASIDEMISLLQMPSNFPSMHDSKEVISQWNSNFWISKKNYAKLLKKANISYLP